MVTVTGFKRKQTNDGRQFTLLELQGGLEMVRSQQTGRFYATTRKCTVSTTFDDVVAYRLIFGDEIITDVAWLIVSTEILNPSTELSTDVYGKWD